MSSRPRRDVLNHRLEERSAENKGHVAVAAFVRCRRNAAIAACPIEDKSFGSPVSGEPRLVGGEIDAAASRMSGPGVLRISRRRSRRSDAAYSPHPLLLLMFQHS